MTDSEEASCLLDIRDEDVLVAALSAPDATCRAWARSEEVLNAQINGRRAEVLLVLFFCSKPRFRRFPPTNLAILFHSLARSGAVRVSYTRPPRWAALAIRGRP